MAAILQYSFPWTEEPGGLQSMRSQRVKHDLATKPPPPHYMVCSAWLLYTPDLKNTVFILKYFILIRSSPFFFLSKKQIQDISSQICLEGKPHWFAFYQVMSFKSEKS